MGKRGTKSKPTKIKKMEGNPGRYPLNDSEPEPTTEEIFRPAPDHLSKDALAYWQSEGPKLHRLGLLTDIDYPAFEKCAVCFGRWQETEREIKTTGLVIETTNGNVIQNPLLSIARGMMQDLHKYESVFGKTPSDRTGITAKTPKKKSKFGDLSAVPGGKK